MKKVIALFIGVCSIGILFAQDGVSDERYLEILIQSEKRDIIKDAMTLNEEEAEPFWTLYDAYEIEFESISEMRWRMLEEYSSAYPKISDDLANVLIHEMYDVNTQVYALRYKYALLIAESCSPQTAARWVQVDDLINTALKLSWGSQLPFIGDQE